MCQQFRVSSCLKSSVPCQIGNVFLRGAAPAKHVSAQHAGTSRARCSAHPTPAALTHGTAGPREPPEPLLGSPAPCVPCAVSPVPCPPRTTVSVALRAPVRGAEPRSCSQRRGGAQPSPRRHGASAQPPRVTASHFVMNRIVSARMAHTRSMPRVSQVT